ncbi:hypothetical protein KC333_g6494 [Hortaea werneckii]|nr:hypothetical protein KC333_g6494 [Hortaea werneckii]KAI7310587.1 hypothetical protein KC326_g6623 [Hortaea werneckii]
MFSPVPLINRIDRLKESETRISLDDIWDYPVRPQRFSMWSTQPPHPRNTPPLRAAGRGMQHPNCSSASPSSSPAGTGKKETNPPNQPRALPSSPSRATLPSALRFATSHPPSPPCALVRRSAQHGRPSPITSRTPRGPQKAGPSDARPSSLKWRIPVHTDGVQAGVVPSIVISPPDDAGNLVCSSSSSPSSASNVDSEKETDKEEDTRTRYLRRTTTRILGPAKSESSPGSTSSRCDQPNSTPSQPLDVDSDPRYTAPEAEEDFTLPEDYASTLRLSIVHCPRRKRAWRVVERCLDGVWRRVGW